MAGLQIATFTAQPPTFQGDAKAKRKHSIDPIFALLEKHAKLKALWVAKADALDDGERAAEKLFGRHPYALIAWRNYSHIGGTEIEDRREEFLSIPGVNPAEVEAEYRDAKARYRSAIAREDAWYQLAGLSELRKELRAGIDATRKCEGLLKRAKPTTTAGVAALLQYLIDEDLCVDEGWWHVPAIKNAIAALTELSG